MPPSSAGGGYRGFMTLYATQGAGIVFTTEGYQSGGSYFLQWQTNTQTHDGYPGYRTDQILPISKFASFANVTLIHIGTNDMIQSLKNGTITPSSAFANLQQIVTNVLQQNSKTQIIIAQIIPVVKPVTGYTDYTAANTNINTYNSYITSSAFPTSISIVNMNNLLNPSTDYSPDGVHPNYSGYQKMACKWIQEITGISQGPCLQLSTDSENQMPTKYNESLATPSKIQIDALLTGQPII